MSNQVLQSNSNMQAMGPDTATYNCPYCHADILESNKQTHEARCERMHQQNRSAMEEEPIQRTNFSRNPPTQVNQTARTQARREDRRAPDNKFIICPTCEKSVREQDFSRHQESECVDKDLIPCEVCGQQVPMRLYTQHAEECLMRTEAENRRQQQEQIQPFNQNRPGAQRQQDRHMSVERERPQQQNQSQRSRDSNSEEAPSRGFMGFLRDLVRPRDQEREREDQEQNSMNSLRNLFSQPQPQTQSRTQQFNTGMNSGMNTGMSNRNNMSGGMEFEDPRAQLNGATVIRTVERGPFGSTIIRTRVVPNQQRGQIGQVQQQRQPQQMIMPGLEEMGPLGMFFNLINGGGFFGMQQFPMDDLEGMLQEQSKGLDKETIDRMSVVKYDKEKYKNVDQEARTCPICLEEFKDGDELRFLWCMHRFHRGCVDTWLEKNSNCPICKKEFSEAEHVGNSP